MKKFLISMLLLATLSFLRFEHVNSSVDTQDVAESSLHELARADQYSFITMRIRQLVSSLHDVMKELSSLRLPVSSVLGNNELYIQQMNDMN